MAWIARLYRCGRAGKLHVELGRAPEIVEVAVAVRCGRLVLSNLNKFYSVSSRSATTAPGHMRLSVIRACGSLPHVDSSAGAPCTPLPCRTTMSPRGALHQNPNGNATRFVNMDEVFLGECPKTKGAASRCCVAARLRVGRDRARVRKRSNKATYKRAGQVGGRVLLASPGSLLGAASRTVRPRARTSPRARARTMAIENPRRRRERCA